MTTQTAVQLPQMLTKKEVAEIFNCNPRTIDNWLAAGQFPQPLRVGGSHRWAAPALLAYLTGLESAAIEADEVTNETANLIEGDAE